MMSEVPRSRVRIPTADQLRFMHETLTWLDGLRLTLEDAEATIRERCSLSEEGASPEEIVSFFCESHNVSALEAHRIGDLAALLLFRGRLKRLKGGRYVHAQGRARPQVLAVVRVPTEEWERFQGLGVDVRAAYVIGPEDRA